MDDDAREWEGSEFPTGPVVCAWCGAVIRDGAPGATPSHGICAACVGGSGLVAVEFVHGLDARGADALPLGFMRLDHGGVIQSYNRTEARLSGLTGERVVGRDFFREVAPCTRVKEFHGRFLQLQEAGLPARTDFRFLFRFEGGDRLVHVVMSYHPERGTVILIKEV